MAFLLGRKNLICFYCGSKSKYVQDGSIREWECMKCDAVNYLDENGEIADPPVAELHEISRPVKYAQTVTHHDPAESSKSENNLFCDACLKNQHLFTSSLAQYIPDDSNPLIDRKYIKFREDLEKRYPQVCEDCAPRILERYNRSQYTAKADHMRRLMDRTRANGGPRKARRSWIDNLGRTLYLLGILGQIYWNLAGIYGSIRSRILDTCTSDEIVLEEPPSTIHHLSTSLVSVACWIISLEAPFLGILKLIPFLESDGYSTLRLAKWCFWSSVMSIWWNPRLKQSISGFDAHLKGLSDWYKYHIILLISRIIFRYVMNYEALGNPDIPATLGAHTFMLGFTTFIAIAAPRSIKTDTSRLFTPLTPEKLRPYVGPSKAAIHKDSIIHPIDDVFDSPPRVVLSCTGYNDKTSGMRQAPMVNSADGSFRPKGTSVSSPSNILGPTPFSSLIDDDEDGEEMDWDPAPPQHLNFQLAQAPRVSQLLSQPTAPVPLQPSPFKGKLPPAPISMAHKLRNPPNQPRLQPPSRKAKENFFDRMSGRQIATGDETSAIANSKSLHRHEVEFAQPRFFAPDAEDPTGLTEAFESAFRLDSDESKPRETKRSRSRLKAIDWTHIFRALVLLLDFFVWKYALSYQSEYPAYLPPISMLVCGLIALLSMYDYTISQWAKRQPRLIVIFGGIFAITQTLAAAYTMNGIDAKRAYNRTSESQGALLIGAMLVQEACFAAFKKT